MRMVNIRLIRIIAVLIVNVCPLFSIEVINKFENNELEEVNPILIREKRSSDSNYNFCLPSNIQLNYGSNRVRINEAERFISLNIYSRHSITIDVILHLNDISFFHSGPDRVSGKINSWELSIYPLHKPFWSTIEIKALPANGYWHILVKKLNGLSRTIESWEKTKKNIFDSLELFVDGIERYYIGDPVHDCSKYSDPPTTSTTQGPTSTSTFILPTTTTTMSTTTPTVSTTTTTTTKFATTPTMSYTPTTMDTSSDVNFITQRNLSKTVRLRPIFSETYDYPISNETNDDSAKNVFDTFFQQHLFPSMISPTPSDIRINITNSKVDDSSTDMNFSTDMLSSTTKTDFTSSSPSTNDQIIETTLGQRENISLMNTDLPMIFNTTESSEMNDRTLFYTTESDADFVEHEDEYINTTEPNTETSTTTSVNLNEAVGIIAGESRWAIPRDFIFFWSIPVFVLLLLILVTIFSLYLLKKAKQRKVSIRQNDIAMKSKDSFRLIQDGSGEFVYRPNIRTNPIAEQSDSTISLSSSQLVKSEHGEADGGSENDPIYSVSFSSEEYNLSNMATLNLQQMVNETGTVCFYGEV